MDSQVVFMYAYVCTYMLVYKNNNKYIEVIKLTGGEGKHK